MLSKEKQILKNSRRLPVNTFLLFFLLMFFMLPYEIFPAINYVSNTNVYVSGISSSFSFTTSAGANRVLLAAVAVMDDRPEYNITSMTYGSQSFTLITRTASGALNGTGVINEMWYLQNPVSGTGTITVNQANSVRRIVGVSEYSGVSAIGASNAVSGSGSSLSVPITTIQGRSRIAGIFSQRTNAKMTFTPVTGGLVERWTRQAKVTTLYLRAAGEDMPTVAAGAYNISYSSNKSNYCAMIGAELRAAMPVVISCSPAVGYTGGGQSVTITGANFDNGCTVTIGGNNAAVTYVNPTTLRITTPAHAAGAVDVVVTNLDTQSATGTGIFTYSPFMPPSVTSCVPASGSTLGGQAITVNGANFVNGCSVLIGGIPAAGVTFISSSAVSVTAPASSAGLKSVTVTNPDTQFFTRANTYTYVIPAPLVSACTPASGLTAGGQSITITGKYFVSGCTVTIGGAPATGLTFINTQTIRVLTPARAAGPANVVVRNPDAQTGTLTGGFTYFTLAAPALTSCSPVSGPAAGGQAITVNGTNFVSGCTVYFNAVTATSVVFIDATRVTAITPAHAAITVDVSVRNPDTQTAVKPLAYTYAVPPAVTSCSPPSGKPAGGITIDINGTNFRPGCVVTIGGVPAAVTRVSTSLINATTPPHAAGAVDVKVSNIDFTDGTLAAGFTYDGTLPVISLNGGGSSVTIAAGTSYTEAVSALDDFDGDITNRISTVISDHLGATVSAVSGVLPETFTLVYNVSDTAGNQATALTRTVYVTDQTPPVINLNGGGSSVHVMMLGDVYNEAATALDNIDGNLTASMIIVIRDHLGTIVPAVSSAVTETFTITYDVTDAAGNAAAQETRTVLVVADAPVSIAITTPAAKLVYLTGESLDISGMVVTGTYASSATGVLSVTTANITGFNSSAPVNGQVLTVTVDGVSTTFTVDIVGVSSIAVTALPLKTNYDINEPLDITGLVITATYSNGGSGPVTVTASNITGFSSLAAQAGQVLTVTYATKTATFTVNIVPTLVSIAITTPPAKLIYDIGETLSIAGMVVTGTYTDSSQQVLSILPANVTGLDTSAAALAQVLTVTYGTKTTQYTVDIVPTLSYISITTLPTKIVFNVGDALDISGMIVTGTYTDGGSAPLAVTLSNVTGFNSSIPVTGQTLTVTISGKSAFYQVDIVQPLLVSIAVTTPALKLTYTTGEALDITGMIVTGTYDDASTNILPVTLADITGFDSAVPAANQVLTITYDGKTTTFTVQIIEPAPVVYSVSPASGPAAGGTAITLDGENFVNGCTVTIGGVSAAGVVFVDDLTLNMDTPAHAAGTVDITVTNPDTQTGTGTGIFTYTGAATATPTYTMSSTPTASRTQSATSSPTFTRTATSGTSTSTSTRTPSYTRTASPTATRSGTQTDTATKSATPTITMTGTPSHTPSDSPTVTNTSTASPTSTITQTHTVSPTVTPTSTITATNTPGYPAARPGVSYVFPQPAYTVINIACQLDSPAELKIYVYNAAGMQVADGVMDGKAGGHNLFTFPLDKFSPGVYYYLIRARLFSGGEFKFPVNKFLVAGVK